MYEARSAEYIQIYESFVIELFLRLKIHKIGTCAQELIDKIVSVVNQETLGMYIVMV